MRVKLRDYKNKNINYNFRNKFNLIFFKNNIILEHLDFFKIFYQSRRYGRWMLSRKIQHREFINHILLKKYHNILHINKEKISINNYFIFIFNIYINYVISLYKLIINILLFSLIK